MFKKLPRRKRLTFLTMLAAALAVLLIVAVVWLPSAEQTQYRPGESIEGITAELRRNLPKDFPAVKFVDVSREAGITFQHFFGRRTSQLPEDMGPGVAWADYDNDGWQDIFVANAAGPLTLTPEEREASPAHCALYHNNGDGTFTEVSKAAGIDFRRWANSAAWGDDNNDGLPDLFVTCYGQNVFYRNNGDGTFTDHTSQTGLGGVTGFWTGAAWADFDKNGFLDLYVCGYVKYVYQENAPMSSQYNADVPANINPSAFEPERNLLYKNNGDGSFSEIAVPAGVVNIQGRSLSASWCDFDEDGWPDLYVANDVSDNTLFRNSGNGTFEDISHAALVADYRGAMGIAVGDWDNDEDMDIFITHWIAQENALYNNKLSQVKNAAGRQFSRLRFMDEADRYGLGQIALDYIGWGTSFFDYDNDGRLDLFVVNGSTFQQNEKPWLLQPMADQLFWNAGRDKGFYNVAPVSGAIFQEKSVSRGAAYADYDNDGDVDLFIANHSGPALLLRNEGSMNNWLKVHLKGTKSNRLAIGARLRLVVGNTVHVRQVGAQSSYCSQNSLVEHFGLGSFADADTLAVIWPSGLRNVMFNVPANQTIEIVEGDLSYKERVQRFWQDYRQATDLRIAGKFEQAGQMYASALSFDPNHEDALYYLGNMMLETGEFEKAEEAWKHLPGINPASTRAYLQLGNLYMLPEAGRLFDIERARAAFQRAQAINGEETGPLLRLGQIALLQEDLVTARNYFDAVIASNFRSAEAYFLNGYIAWKSGNTDRAASMFAKAIEAAQPNAPVKNALSEGDTKPEAPHKTKGHLQRKDLFYSLIPNLRNIKAEDAKNAMGSYYRKMEDSLEQIRLAKK